MCEMDSATFHSIFQAICLYLNIVGILLMERPKELQAFGHLVHLCINRRKELLLDVGMCIEPTRQVRIGAKFLLDDRGVIAFETSGKDLAHGRVVSRSKQLAVLV